MEIKMECPKCGKKYVIRAKLAGRKIECKKCHIQLLIPEKLDSEKLLVVTEQSVLRDQENTWEIGNTIAGIYEIQEKIGEGGFGTVHKVYHKHWNIPLAVKSPRPEKFATPEQQQNFLQEAETWVKLAMHPHLVTCYYVRILGERPRVFLEYVKGSALSQWIHDKDSDTAGVLYQDPSQTLATILDIAIQTAWGITYAHKQNLIHRDIKPENILISKKGAAKVTDFGLAIQENLQDYDTQNVAMTLAYCSPEQADQQAISHKTDVWSWALCVLEMFLGRRTWFSGQLGRLTLENIIAKETTPKVAIPETVVEVLLRCLEEEPQARPNLSEISYKLRDIYEDLCEQRYTRIEPQDLQILADCRNNQAVSLLDIDKSSQVQNLLQDALKSDPHHLQATYNTNLLAWRRSQITDVQMIQSLNNIRISHDSDYELWYLLGWAHIERNHPEEAKKAFEKALQQQNIDGVAKYAISNATSSLKNGYRCNRIFKGHTNSVRDAIISKDGRVIISAGWDNEIRIWDTYSGTCLAKLKGHKNYINRLAIVKDKLIISASWDKTLKVWDIVSGKCIYTLKEHNHYVDDVVVHKGRAISVGWDGDICVWDIKTGKLEKKLSGVIKNLRAISILADGKTVVCGGADGNLQVWDLEVDICRKMLKGHSGDICAVSADSITQTVISASWDKTLRIWDIVSGDCLRVLHGHEDVVADVAIIPKKKLAISASWDKTLRVWDMQTGRCLRTIYGHQDRVYGVAVGERGKIAVSASLDETVCTWDLSTAIVEAPLAIVRPHKNEEMRNLQEKFICFLNCIQHAIENQNWNQAAQTLRQIRELPGYQRHPKFLDMLQRVSEKCTRQTYRGLWLKSILDCETSWLGAIAYNENTKYCAVSCFRKIQVWDIENQKKIHTISDSTSKIDTVYIDHNTRWIMAAGNSRKIQAWDIRNADPKHSITEFPYPIRAVVHIAHGDLILVASYKDLTIWNLASQKCIATLSGHNHWIESIATSIDGKWAISGTSDGEIKVWDLHKCASTGNLKGHQNSIKSIAMSHQGDLAISASHDNTLKIWDIPNMKCLHTLEDHQAQVNSVAITADGKIAISTGEDEKLRIWDTHTGQCLDTIELDSKLKDLTISWNGQSIIASASDGKLYHWYLDWDYVFGDVVGE